MERGPAVCGCGRPGHEVESVSFHVRPGEKTGELRAGVSNVFVCGSPWLCPPCAVRKARERAKRVRAVAEATYDRGGQVALVVLTASHSADVALSDFKALVQGASRKARQGAPWNRIAARHEILGVVVGQEVTLSRANGWHYHQHLVVPVDGPSDEEAELAGSDRDALEALVRDRAKAAGEAVAERYKAMIRAAGGRVSEKYGTWVRVAKDEKDAADYAAKGSMAWEVAGGAVKDETKAEGSLTPWDLANMAYGGDGWARARWGEYADVMPGTRSCVVSPALAAKLGIEPADAEEDAETVTDDVEVVGEVSAPKWRRWLRHGLASTFLARVEYGGAPGFADSVARTDRDADAIEARQAAKAAERRERMMSASRGDAAAEAAVLVRMSSGSGTRIRIREAIAEVSAVRPDRPPPDETAVVAALARTPDVAPWVTEIADALGGRIVAIEEAA